MYNFLILNFRVMPDPGKNLTMNYYQMYRPYNNKKLTKSIDTHSRLEY